MSGWKRAMVLGLTVLWIWAVPFAFPASAESRPVEPGAGTKKLIYDEAGLLTPAEISELEDLARKLGAKRETDFIILTSDNPQNVDVQKMTEDFYDARAPGYDKPHGNAAILTVDMKNREVYLAGFYKAERYLDNERLDKIRARLTPYLTNGDYAQAFEIFVKTAYEYMGYEPGVNPDNILFDTWFQLAASLVLAAVVVGAMAYNSGGRVTVHRRTYEDAGASRVVERHDRYIRTTVTKTKIPKHTGKSGGGFGGGTGGGGFGGRTGGGGFGGHSHSGSRGSF